MPQNQTASICAPELLENSTPPATFTHKHFKTNEVSNGMESSWSTPPSKLEVKSSMASASIPGSTFGVLLPVCLLAVFLSCVVCVYHWQSLRERRLDMENERKRSRKIIADYDGACALKTFKQTRVRKYLKSILHPHSFLIFRENSWQDFRITPYIYYAYSSLFYRTIVETIDFL